MLVGEMLEAGTQPQTMDGVETLVVDGTTDPISMTVKEAAGVIQCDQRMQSLRSLRSNIKVYLRKMNRVGEQE